MTDYGSMIRWHNGQSKLHTLQIKNQKCVKMIEQGLEAWKRLPTEVIKKSFKVCTLSSNLDGSEDDQ